MKSFQCETYTLPPPRFRPALDVAGVCCEYDGKILLIQRSIHVSQPETWGFAAGKAEKGETIIETALRELKEETGLVLKQNDITYLMKMYCRQPAIDYIFHGFAIVLTEKPAICLNPQEHSAYQWVTVEEALQMNLMGGGQCALRQYQRLRVRLKP